MSLINREDLMLTLGITDTDCEKCGWYSKAVRMCKRGSDFEDACCAIENAPEVLPEPTWIPVSEKLPEENYVLISKKPTKLSGSKWCVTIAIRTVDPRSGKIYWRDIGFGAIPDDDVLAWMPLPEPYRGEGEKQ